MKPPISILETYIARAAEILDIMLRLRQLLKEYKVSSQPAAQSKLNLSEPRTCEYVVKALHGVLYGSFEIEDVVSYQSALIIPTTQNLAAMEDVETRMFRDVKVCENVIKLAKEVAVAFDSCISCSIHSLRVKIVKE